MTVADALNALANPASPVGAPPQVPPVPPPPAAAAAILIPPAQPDVEPPSYDAAHDPAWHGILNPNDHGLRNLLNELSPEHRQLLLVRLGRIQGPAQSPATSSPQTPAVPPLFQPPPVNAAPGI